MIDTTTKTKYEHTGQTVGQQVVYHVRAKRDDITSDPSNDAVIYPAPLQLAA